MGVINLDYYAHTISYNHHFMLSDISTLEKILQSGYLLSRRNLKMDEKETLFNGMDYISLCDLTKKKDYYSAYNIYTQNGLSLLFSRDIEVIIPNYINLSQRSNDMGKEMHRLGLKGRYSDFKDEVQVKDKLSLKYLKGLSIPLEKLCSCHSNEYAYYYLYYVKGCLKNHGYRLPILDLDNEKVIDIQKMKKY